MKRPPHVYGPGLVVLGDCGAAWPQTCPIRRGDVCPIPGCPTHHRCMGDSETCDCFAHRLERSMRQKRRDIA